MSKYIEVNLHGNRFKTNDIDIVKKMLFDSEINENVINHILELWDDFSSLSGTIVEYGGDNVFVVFAEDDNWLESKGHYIVPKGISVIADIGQLHQEYNVMLKQKVPHEEIQKFIIPFRKKYKLSESDTISIANNELSFLQIADILMRNSMN